MKKLSVLVLLLSFCIICGCSKENPTTSNDVNNSNLTDSHRDGYDFNITIIQHTNGADIVLVNRNFFTESYGEMSPTYEFTTSNVFPSTFSVSYSVVWQNTQYATHGWWQISSNGIRDTYLALGSGNYSLDPSASFGLGQTYTYYMGTSPYPAGDQ